VLLRMMAFSSPRRASCPSPSGAARVALLLGLLAPAAAFAPTLPSSRRAPLALASPRMITQSIEQLERKVQQLLPPPSPADAAPRKSTNAPEVASGGAPPNLWLWRALMLAITASWGCNFAVIKLALDSLGDSASAGSLFMAARFGLSALILSPFVLRASSRPVVEAGLSIGALCVAGYACQALSLAMGSAAGTSAFICSLQSVVVALLAARATGFVAPRTWAAIALAVAGVGCLELPQVLAEGGGVCLGDVVAFGQPLGFGASYIVLEQAASDATEEDALPLAALQCLVIGLFGLLASSAAAGQAPLDLDWGLMLPNMEASGLLEQWAVPGAVLYTGVVSTALTMWLQAKVFANLPALDASLVLTTEPLWAALCAVLLLGDTLTTSNYVGGALILTALAVQNELLPSLSSEDEEAREDSTQD